MSRLGILIAVMAILQTHSGKTHVRKFFNEFLNIPVNAQGMSMSEAQMIFDLPFDQSESQYSHVLSIIASINRKKGTQKK